jgi:hypothetical protein
LYCGLAVLFFVGCDKTTALPVAEDRKLPDWMTEEEPAGMGEATPFDNEPSAQLSLQLKQGDRFPLRKVVQQTLQQASAGGTPEVSQSRLEVLFAITIEEVAQQRTKLAVRYDQVKYQHEIAGERVFFDSTVAPATELPVAVWAYRDMVGDGFKFWLGADNQIAEVEGFTDFLKRCLRNVPEQLKSSVMLGMEGGSGEDGIANFVDNSIGLLPYGSARKAGDTWERPRYISRPIPMQLQNQYTLQELTATEAVVAVRGTISAGSTGAPATDTAQFQVLGGSTQGTCTIDRSTGLPKSSNVERVVDMVVRLPQAEFRQQKRILTTIEAFPVASGSNVIQVGFQQ